MSFVRIFTVAFILLLAAGAAGAAPGEGAVVFSSRGRLVESRAFLLEAAQTKVDLERSFIVPGSDSLILNGAPLARGDEYRINTLRGSIILVTPASGGERLVVRFSRYPLPFSPVFAAHVVEGGSTLPLEVTPPRSQQKSARRSGEPYQLRLSGSKTVGFSIGSNRDLGLDQSLKVTMVGKVAKDLEVSAFLSDDNLPVQREGNTEELKYLDRVYVQVKSAHSEVQLGDFTSGLSWSRFSSFQRELRGVTANVNAAGQAFFAGGGVAKGRFKTASFRGREGVQGPYELLSARRFNAVIVLPGTERAYFNGRLLKRGSENDYTIDYNRGTITFMEKLPVTDDSEIVIDYEIGEDNFERTTLAAGWTSSAFGGALRLRTFFFQESDDGEKPIGGAVSASERAILAAAGDDPEKAFAVGIERVEDGTGNYILVPADSAPAHFEFVETGGSYRLDFYEVKALKGDYRTDGFSSRGVVRYRYAGENGGDYRVGRSLPLPERKRLVAVGVSSEKGAFFFDAEGDVSSRDMNLFSAVDDGDNAGRAIRFEGGVKNADLRAAKLSLTGEYSSLEDRFASPDKPRESYFYRDWGLEDVPLSGREDIGGARIGLAGKRSWSVDGSYQFLSRRSALSARKAEAAARIGDMESRGLSARALGSSAGDERERQFVQGSGIFSFWRIAPRLTLETERFRALSATSPDTGRYYRQGVVSLSGRNIGAYRANLSLSRRLTDNLASSGEGWFRRRENDEIGFDGGYAAGGRIVEILVTHRRNRDVPFNEISWLNLARMRGRDVWERAGLAADVSYRVSSGEERTRVKAVVFVGENQGDYDKEGREVGQKRGDYMLLYLPGGDKEPVRTVELGMQVSAGAGVRGIGGEMGDRGFLGRLRKEVSLDHFFSVLEKSRSGDLFGLYTLRPSLLQRNDLTVYGINKLREECTLFNSSRVFKLRLTYSREDEEDNRSEGSSADVFFREFRARAESAPWNFLAISWEAGTGVKRRTTSGLFDQNYRVESFSGSQVLNYRLNPSTRLSFELGAERRSDAVSSAKQISYAATPSLNASIGRRFNMAAFVKITYTNAEFEAGKPLFFLEEGLREDWSLMGQYRFSRNMSFGLNYTGRREKDYAGEVKTVHDLKMESRAYF